MVHTMKKLVLLCMFAICVACHPIVLLASSEANVQKNNSSMSAEEKQRRILVRQAQSMLSRRNVRAKGKTFRADCSGFIEGVSYAAGIDIKNDTTPESFYGSGVDLIRNYLAQNGDLDLETPKVGDLIFFSDTYDKNKDGKLNDPMTHVGIINQIDEDGSVHYIHHSNGRVRSGIANLFSPDLLKNAGNKVVNSDLRRRRSRDRSATPYMSGDLAVGFGSFFKEAIQTPSNTISDFIGPSMPSTELIPIIKN